MEKFQDAYKTKIKTTLFVALIVPTGKKFLGDTPQD